MKLATDLDLAEEVLFWGCKQLDGNTQDGTTFASADAALKRWGQPEEHYWPYDDKLDVASNAYRPPLEAIDSSLCWRVQLREIDRSLASVRAQLAADRVVMIGIPIWSTIFVLPDGMIPMPSSHDTLLGGHAVLAVGFDDMRRHITIRNSWGSGWGDQGYGYLPYAYIEQHLITAWVAESL